MAYVDLPRLLIISRSVSVANIVRGLVVQRLVRAVPGVA